MKDLSYLAVRIGVLIFLTQTTVQDNIKECQVDIQTQNDYVSLNGVSSSQSNSTEEQCKDLCLSNPECLSADYNFRLQTCYTYNSSQSGNLRQDDCCQHYEKIQKNCEERIDVTGSSVQFSDSLAPEEETEGDDDDDEEEEEDDDADDGDEKERELDMDDTDRTRESIEEDEGISNMNISQSSTTTSVMTSVNSTTGVINDAYPTTETPFGEDINTTKTNITEYCLEVRIGLSQEGGKPVTLQSLEDCESMCLQDPDCASATWSPMDDTCWVHAVYDSSSLSERMCACTHVRKIQCQGLPSPETTTVTEMTSRASTAGGHAVLSPTSTVLLVGAAFVLFIALGTVFGFYLHHRKEKGKTEMNRRPRRKSAIWMNEYNSPASRNLSYWYADNPLGVSPEVLRRVSDPRRHSFRFPLGYDRHESSRVRHSYAGPACSSRDDSHPRVFTSRYNTNCNRPTSERVSSLTGVQTTPSFPSIHEQRRLPRCGIRCGPRTTLQIDDDNDNGSRFYNGIYP